MPDTLNAAPVGRTAVIDVGSNSVRLVIFGDSVRAPLTMINEKAFCRLGAGVVDTGLLNPEGVVQTIATLKRFRWLAESAGVDTILAFATAAVRDATDGLELVARAARECGVHLQVLSGEEEAEYAGLGILFGIPDADGLVADMGGSSMELAAVSHGATAEGTSLPVAPPQYPGQPLDVDAVSADVDRHLDRIDWLDRYTGKSLYLVGGTWRAFAKLDIGMRNYSLNIIQNYEMDGSRARELTQLVAQQSLESLRGAYDISERRLLVLPATSVVLDRLLQRLQPDRLVFSGHGVREGAYFGTLDPDQREKDPLMAGVEAIARHEARFGTDIGHELFDWMTPLFPDETPYQRQLRQAACMLSDVGWRTHPDYRATQSYRRILRAPLIGISHAGRSFLAIAVLRRYSQKAGKDAIDEARSALESESIERAEQVGSAMRLALTLGGGNSGSLRNVRIALESDELVLSANADFEFVFSEATAARLANLAKNMDCKARTERWLTKD